MLSGFFEGLGVGTSTTIVTLLDDDDVTVAPARIGFTAGTATVSEIADERIGASDARWQSELRSGSELCDDSRHCGSFGFHPGVRHVDVGRE